LTVLIKNHKLKGSNLSLRIEMSKRIFLVLTTFVAPILISGQALAAWSSPVKISGSSSAHVPSIAVGANGVVHVVYTQDVIQDGFFVDTEIYYARSADGVNFSAPVDISNSPNNFSGEPVISVADDQSNDIHVVWEEYNPAQDSNGVEVYYNHSADGGITWPSANIRNISNNPGPSGSPYIFVDSTPSHTVHIAWTDYGSNSIAQIYYSRSINNGSSFLAPLNISNSTSDNDQPAIAADSAGVHIVWEGPDKITYVRSTNGGVSFGTPKRLSTSSDVELEPTIGIDGSGRIQIAWQAFNSIGGSDIFWTRSLDVGATFSVPVNRSNNPSTVSQTSFIGSKNNRITLLWIESLASGNQSYETRSSNGGGNWTTPSTVGPSSFTAEEPDVVVKASNYATWEDNGQIFYSKD
jgi:hypothetical protein